MYRLLLEMRGHSVRVAADGTSGLEAAQTGDFDLVLLDVELPGTDGISILGILHADPCTRDIPVVMIINHGDPVLREKALELGARDYVVKSRTSPRELAERVESWADAGLVQPCASERPMSS